MGGDEHSLRRAGLAVAERPPECNAGWVLGRDVWGVEVIQG